MAKSHLKLVVSAAAGVARQAAARGRGDAQRGLTRAARPEIVTEPVDVILPKDGEPDLHACAGASFLIGGQSR